MRSLLKANSLSVTYSNGMVALKQVDIEIQEGEIVLLAGATGSGKSTLAMRLINVIPHQIKAQCNGEVFLNQQSTQDTPPHLLSRQIQLLLQNPESMLFSLSAEENIYFGMENLNWTREAILKRTDIVCDLMKISSLRNRSPLNLSGGEQQAVALAGILTTSPSLFILDEPLTYLDQIGKKRLLEYLNCLKKEGKTILILEHRLDLAQEIADRILVLRDGEKVVDTQAKSISEEKLKSELGLRATSFFQFSSNEDSTEKKKEILKCEDLSFSYTSSSKDQTDQKVLNNINFSMQKGEIIAFLGPNGSGKSTLANCLIGLEKSFQGEILIQNKKTVKFSHQERAKQIGMMFQRPEIQLFCQTVKKELTFGALNIDLPKKLVEERVEKEAQEFHLTSLLKQHPATLSRGEMRRLVLASLLVMRPSIFILDEPTIGQDYTNLIQIGKKIHELSRQGHTFLLITHDHDFAKQLATRVIQIERGEIIQDATL